MNTLTSILSLSEGEEVFGHSIIGVIMIFEANKNPLPTRERAG